MRSRVILPLAWLLGLAAMTGHAAAAPGAGSGGDDDEDAPPAASAPSAEVAGPPVSEVLAEAYRAAGLDRSPGRGWVRRARAAGLIPWVSARAGRNTSWQDLDPEVDRGTTIEVRATWRLDRLLFDGRELQVASIEAARRRERRQLAGRVIRAYFHWRRLAGAAAADSRWTPRADEAAAELDAFTDGWFSRQLAPPRGDASAAPR